LTKNVVEVERRNSSVAVLHVIRIRNESKPEDKSENESMGSNIFMEKKRYCWNGK